MARILVIVPFPLDARNLAQRRLQLDAVRLGPHLEFEYRPVRVAPSNYISGHDFLLAELSIIDAGLSAQEEGFDAVCIDTMSDSGMNVLRSMLDIPVIGPGRHCMLAALMLGEKFSILTMWDEWAPLYTKTLAELGLQHKCASIRAAGIVPDNRNLLDGKEDAVYPQLLATAQRCVDEDGADVLILGSTTMHGSHAYLAERLSVPLINPGPMSYRLADAALRLGVSHSRSAYPASLVPKPDLIRAMARAGAAADTPTA